MLLNNLNVIRNCVLLANFNSKKKIYLILGYLNIYMLKCQVHLTVQHLDLQSILELVKKISRFIECKTPQIIKQTGNVQSDR